jgi:hypothetical protein
VGELAWCGVAYCAFYLVRRDVPGTTPSLSAASHGSSSPLQRATPRALLGDETAVFAACLSPCDRYQQ